MTNHRTFKSAMGAFVAAGVVALSITGPAGSVAAAEPQNNENDAAEYKLLSDAKLTLAQAVDAAEKKMGGKAVNAALDNEAAKATFEVELMTATGSETVAVDGATGDVVAVADTNGDGDGQDKE